MNIYNTPIVPNSKRAMLNLCLLLYANDIILLANSAENLQNSLNVSADYCTRWKLTVNAT